VRGKLVILTNVPKEIQAATVELFFDEKSIGSANSKPYKVEFDCSSIPDGEHRVKAVGHSADGAEVWSASTRVRVANNETPESHSTEVAPPTISRAPSAPVQGSVAKSPTLESTYSSKKYGFSIMHPAGWIVKDETSTMKRKSSDGFWLTIGAPPVVVNIHRGKLAPNTDAEVFARYNSYVRSWERKAVASSPAFVVTDGKPELKRVVHRVIFIKDGSAWMANCIDTTGGSAAETAKLLEDMLETIRTVGNGVTITPMK
ncbi:MAG: hypothetical protein ACYC64_20465, partial [Armatimonadota bacterium]